MTWNYRLTKQGDEIAIREVYYNDYNEVVSWTEDPVSLVGESFKELRKDLRRITECLKHPILDLDHFHERKKVFEILDHHLNNGCTDERCDPLGAESMFPRKFVEHLTEEVLKEKHD